MVDVSVELIDGSYHDVDSNEMAFSVAAGMGIKNGCEAAHPVILEPIMAVEVTTPEEYMGDIIGDLNRRRGMVSSMDDIPTGKSIKAEVPLSEMFGYSNQMRSLTQGRANYSMAFEKYMDAPKNIQDEIIASSKKGS